MTQHHSRAVRRVRRLSVGLAGLLAVTGALPLLSQSTPVKATAAEREAVRRAALDYIEGFYEGDSVKLVRSVRPDVYKFGFWRARDSTSYVEERMTWPEFLSYARGVKEKNRQAPATAPKQVEVYDVLNQTASVKVTAFWGTDYLLLGKYNGKWMISSVLWQNPPKAMPAER